jgi:hypothetical protein
VFNPVNTIQTVDGANIAGVNFIATPVGSSHSISGTITASGAGLAGVTVSLVGTSVTTTTNAVGAYSFAGLAAGPYTITPSKTGYTFSPTSSSQTLASADITNVNFTATLTSLSSRMTVRLFTSGTATQIGALNMMIQLPAGVSVKSAQSPPSTDPGVAFPSGNASSSELFTATYSAASRTIFLNLGSTTGFASGEFAKIVCDLNGVNPTASDFTVLEGARLKQPDPAIVDPAYSFALAAALVAGRRAGPASPTARRAGWSALTVSTLYLGAGLAMNLYTEAYAQRQLRDEGVEAARVSAYPTLLQLPYRRVVARSGDDVRIGFVTLLRPRPIQWERFTQPSGSAVEAARATSEVRLFEWFAMGEATPRVVQDGALVRVEFDDLRYGLPGRPRDGLWGLRLALDASGRPLGPAGRFDRELPGPVSGILILLWRETLGLS